MSTVSNALSDQLELWGTEEDYFLFKDGSIGLGMKLDSIDVSSLSDDEINSLKASLKNFLNSIPEGVDLQFVKDIESGNSKALEDCLSLVDKDCNKACLPLIKEKTEQFKTFDDLGILPKHSLYLFIRKSFENEIVKNPGLLGSLVSSKKKRLELSESTLKKEVLLLQRIYKDLSESLSSLEIRTEILPTKKALDMVYRQWNPDRPINLGKFNPEDLRDDLLFTDVFVNEKGFELSDYHYRVISLKNLPDQTFSSMSALMSHMPFGSRVFLNIGVPNQTAEIDYLKSQRRVAYSMVIGKKGVSDIESSLKYEDLESLLQEMIADGEKVFHTSLNVLLKSKCKEDLKDQVAQVLSILREMGGSEGLIETLASFEIFKQISLPNARNKERVKRLKSSNLTDFLPVYAPWKGHNTPHVLLKSAHGSLLSFDPFDASHTNANQLISAGSGAGKSVLTNLLLLQMLKSNPRVFIVDIGGSYKKLCENLNGEYINLGLDSGISINPFDLKAGEITPSPSKVKFLVGLTELIVKEDGKDGLPKLLRSLLEEAIMRVYERREEDIKKGVFPLLSDLRELLLESDQLEIRNIGKVLSSWCGDSPFGSFIDRPTSVSLENTLISFDLKNLESYPDFQALCLYLISDLIWSEIQRNRFQMKFVVFDECWKLLKDRAGQDFIESIFRTCRKYFTSCIAISQAIQDFSESSISSAIIPNCSIKWLLQQGQSDLSQVGKILALNENELSLVSGLSQRKGLYSEGYLVSGIKNRALVRIEPTPLELWLATTNPKDLKVIEERKAKNPDKTQLEILKDLALEYPQGV